MSAKALASVLGIALLFAGCLTYPVIHNRYVHPIGRMSGEIQIGTSCETVDELFLDYVQNSGTSQANIGRGTTTRDLYQTRDVAQSGCLSLYDVNLFGDVQIRVRCDATTKKVVDRLIVLD